MGTTTTPPPRPVSAPRNPASSEPSPISPVNSRTFMVSGVPSSPRTEVWILHAGMQAVRCWILSAEQDRLEEPRRGTQVVRERSAKPLCVGSIPTRASNLFPPVVDEFKLHRSRHTVVRARYRKDAPAL